MKKTTGLAGRPAADGDPSLASSDTIAAQLRRWREAASRMPPLTNGKRDPWDPYPRDGRWT
jgi:hypothetical protein